MTFPERLRAAKVHRRIGVRPLADAAQITPAHLWRLLASEGKRGPSCELVERLARALRVSPGWLAYGEGEMTP